MDYLAELTEWFTQKVKIHETSLNPKFHFVRGEIWHVNFGINIGSEFNYTRPALVYQNPIFSGSDTVMVIPITKFHDEKKLPEHDIYLEKSLGSLDMDSILRIWSMRTISKRRIGKKIGKITDSEILDKIDTKIILFLWIKKLPQDEEAVR
jgi:mRNA interferase MazF